MLVEKRAFVGVLDFRMTCARTVGGRTVCLRRLTAPTCSATRARWLSGESGCLSKLSICTRSGTRASLWTTDLVGGVCVLSCLSPFKILEVGHQRIDTFRAWRL